MMMQAETQPLTVSPSGDRYFLVVAARVAGLATAPVHGLPTLQSRETALELQLPSGRI
jgi:hypothetical protein